MAKSQQRNRRWPGVALSFITLAIFIASLIADAVLRNHDNKWKWYEKWLYAQIATTVAVFAVPQARQFVADAKRKSAEQREFEARVEMVVTMNNALDPILRLVGEIAAERTKRTRDVLRGQLIGVVLTTASTLIGPEKSRSCWFALEEGPPKKLVPQRAMGRTGGPSNTTFVEGTEGGDAAINMVLDDRDRICDDIEASPPPGWDAARTRDYRSFISVSVIAGPVALGMLTLDAEEPGSLTADDARLLRVIAGAMAIGLCGD